MDAGANALEVRGLSKTFGVHRALRDFSFEVRAGEIHALVGENGSGKSTIVKCLSGYHHPDPGAEISVGGRPLSLPYGAEQAGAYGFSFVHQDLGLVPTLSVNDNLWLGQPPQTGIGYRVQGRRERKVVRDLLARLGRPDIDPRALVKGLSMAAQTVVAIARCLHNGDRTQVMVFDEPTAALADQESARLFEAIRSAADQGCGIVYISHRLEEVRAIADRITVIRDGAKVTTSDTAELTHGRLVELIVGRPLDAFYPAAQVSAREDVVLEVDELSGERVDSVSFSVHEGEIVGVAGLLGSGKSELGRLLFGAQKITGGHLKFRGERLAPRGPGDAIKAGIAMVPANRHRDGAHLTLSVADNMTLCNLGDYFRGGRLRAQERRARAVELIDQFDVRPRDPDRIMATLSGGNQQKAILAKWIHRDPALLILDEPAQGIDIGAKTDVFRHLEDASKRGIALIVMSEEFDDLVHLCDRVLLMKHGRLIADLSGEHKTRQQMSTLVYNEDAAPGAEQSIAGAIAR